MKGGVGNTTYDPTMYWRCIFAAVIMCGIKDALGEEMSALDKSSDRSKRRMEGIKYVLSDEFPEDMEVVGMLNDVRYWREKVVNNTSKLPLGCEEVAAKYRSKFANKNYPPEKKREIAQAYIYGKAYGETLESVGERYGVSDFTVKYYVEQCPA